MFAARMESLYTDLQGYRLACAIGLACSLSGGTGQKRAVKAAGSFCKQASLLLDLLSLVVEP